MNGAAVRAARLAVGMSQQLLAKRAEHIAHAPVAYGSHPFAGQRWSLSRVRRIEAGAAEATEAEQTVLAAVLGVPASMLAGRLTESEAGTLIASGLTAVDRSLDEIRAGLAALMLIREQTA